MKPFSQYKKEGIFIRGEIMSSVKRLYNLFPDGNNPVIVKMPLQDTVQTDNGNTVRFPISYDDLDNEITISYQNQFISLADFKRKFILTEQSDIPDNE